MSRIKHQTPNYSDQGKGNFGLAYHLEMISDTERVKLFKKGIDKLVNNETIFCELGCGSGIFSIYAASKAKKVYAVEYDENIFKFAQKNICSSPYSDKITLIFGDATKVELPEKVDVIFCEMLSIWMIEEPQVLVMNHAIKNLLKSNGKTIPEKIINLAELCHMDYEFDQIEIKAPIPQFTGIKYPRIMTESKVINSISFNTINSQPISTKTEFKALTSGIINSVRLSSITNISDGIHFYSTDTLMPLTIVPLSNEIEVKETQRIILGSNYKYRTNMDNVEFFVEEIK